MDGGVEQADGRDRMCSPGCEERDAGREEQRETAVSQDRDRERLRVKLPQRSDMICGFASLKGGVGERGCFRDMNPKEECGRAI